MKNKQLKEQISETLFRFGISPNLKGFHYLGWCIEYVMDKEMHCVSMTRELYPSCAEAFQTTASRVERAMRHAIERSSDKNTAIVDKFAALLPCHKSCVPSNSQFVMTIANDIKLKGAGL